MKKGETIRDAVIGALLIAVAVMSQFIEAQDKINQSLNTQAQSQSAALQQLLLLLQLFK